MLKKDPKQDVKMLIGKLEKYIERKVNEGNDKHIPFRLIPDSLKIFWAEYYKNNPK